MTLLPYEGQLGIWGGRLPGGAQLPAIRADVRETGESFIVEAELPGVKKNDVQIVCQEGVLTISVRAEESAEKKEESYLRRERFKGESMRSFSLRNIDEASITAKMEDGVLTLTLPKVLPEEKHIAIE
jgi:Molecular chaperone (small heat shock protein)